MAADDLEVLKFSVDIGGQRARAQMSAISKSFKAHMEGMSKGTAKVNAVTEKLTFAARNFGTDYAKGLKLTSRQMNALNQEVGELNRQIIAATRNLETASSSQVAATKMEIKAYQEKIDLLKDISKLQRTANLQAVFEEATEEMGDELRREVEDAFKSIVKFKWSDAGEQVTEGFTDALGSLSSRDLAGFAKGFARSLGGATKGVGSAMVRKGMAMKADPDAGKIAKMVGGAFGKMGPVLETVAKLGPVLSMVSGAVMAVVKLFIDAEAAAKEFNKELLASASTSSFLAKNSGDVNAAMSELESTVNEIRDAATSLDNLKWGINKKDHLAVLNTLNAEGVSLTHMKEEAQKAGKAMGAFSADMVHVAVAYSRNFGVSLNEISNFQAEMMTELGGSLASTSKDFAAMQMGADEAGIASNKFFNIIKGVSSDLSLYNMRMEDAVHMLTLLGKVMSPRNAQKFLQTTMQGFKTMGRTEKLRMTLLAGQGATKDIVERDLNRKTKSLAEKIKDATGGKFTTDTIEKAIRAGGEDAKAILAEVPKDQKGEFNEAMKQIQIDTKRSKRGLFGLSTATGNLGAGGVFEMYKKSIGRFGGKSLEESAGSIGGEMMAENLGISQEQLNQAILFEQAINDQKDALVKQGWKKEKVDKMGTDEVLDTMSKDDKELLLNAGKQVDYAKKSSDLTSSILDKIETIMDFLLNQFYSLMMDLYDSVVDLLPEIFGDERKRKKQDLAYRKQVEATGDKDAIKAMANAAKKMEKAGELSWRAKDEMITGKGSFLGDFMDKTRSIDKQIEDVVSEQNKPGLSDKDRAEIKAKEDALRATKRKGEIDVLGHASAQEQYTALGDAANTGAIDKAKADKIMAAMLGHKGDQTFVKDGKGVLDVANDLGISLTDKEKTELLGKTFWAKGAGDMPGFIKALKEGDAAKTMGVSGYTGPIENTGVSQKPTSQATSVEQSVNNTGVAGPLPKPGTPDAPATGAQAQSQTSVLEDIEKSQKELKLDKPWMKNEFQKRIEAGTLDALRVALFEYYMYSGLDRTDIIAKMKTGLGSTEIAKGIVDKVSGGGTPKTAKEALDALVAPANAEGGTVMKPAPGEFFASVAPGEKIIPKGGGGAGTVVQHFNGPTSEEFQAFMKNGTLKLLSQWERRKKFQ